MTRALAFGLDAGILNGIFILIAGVIALTASFILGDSGHISVGGVAVGRGRLDHCLDRLPAPLLVAVRPDARDAFLAIAIERTDPGGSAFGGQSVAWSASRSGSCRSGSAFSGSCSRRADAVCPTGWPTRRSSTSTSSGGPRPGRGIAPVTSGRLTPPTSDDPVGRLGAAEDREHVLGRHARHPVAGPVVAEPMCGKQNATRRLEQLGRDLRLALVDVESRPPRSRPSRSASASAAESTRAPRAPC